MSLLPAYCLSTHCVTLICYQDDLSCAWVKLKYDPNAVESLRVHEINMEATETV